MKTFIKLAIPAGFALLVAACGQSGTTIPPPMQPQSVAQQSSALPGGVHVMRPYFGPIARQNTPPEELSYYNGPVQVKQTIYVVYWNWKKYGDPQNVQPTLNGFYTNVGGSKWYSTTTQYYQALPPKDKKQKIKNKTGMYVQNIDDETNQVPAHPTDAQIQAEAAWLATQVGKTVNPSATYVVATPTGHSTQGFGSSFCAYHGAFLDNTKALSYTNLPYMPDAGTNCGANFNGLGELAGVTMVAGHEQAESQTDPSTGVTGDLGWYNSSYGEIGDICAWDSTSADEPFGNSSYPVQPLWSNEAGNCVLTGPKGP